MVGLWTGLRLSRPVLPPPAPGCRRNSPATCGSSKKTSGPSAKPVEKIAILSKRAPEEAQSVEKAVVLAKEVPNEQRNLPEHGRPPQQHGFPEVETPVPSQRPKCPHFWRSVPSELYPPQQLEQPLQRMDPKLLVHMAHVGLRGAVGDEQRRRGLPHGPSGPAGHRRRLQRHLRGR